MARFLPQVVESIVGNTFQDIELIIIDDGSTDDTPTVVKELKQQVSFDIHYYFCRHRGKAGSINHVLKNEAASGKYIVFADADDLLPPQSLQNRYDAIVSSGTELAVGGFAVTDLEGRQKDKRRIAADVNPKELMRRFFFKPKTPFHLNGAIASKALVARTGLFDERLERGQEVDYVVRLLNEATDIRIIPEVVYLYRRYERPLTHRMKFRLRTGYDRCRTIGKHLSGLQRIRATVLHLGCDVLKLGYELLRPYNR